MTKQIIVVRREILDDARALGALELLESWLQDLRDQGFEIKVTD